jgi:hypothetical protein
MSVTCSKIGPVAAAATELVSHVRSPLFGREIAWWFGSWIGSVDRCRIY